MRSGVGFGDMRSRFDLVGVEIAIRFGFGDTRSGFDLVGVGNAIAIQSSFPNPDQRY